MNLKSTLLSQSVRQLSRFAAMLALAGLAIIAYSILSPRPLPVILAMSVGQMLGTAAFLCYLLAVILDVARSGRRVDSIAPKSTGDATDGPRGP